MILLSPLFAVALETLTVALLEQDQTETEVSSPSDDTGVDDNAMLSGMKNRSPPNPHLTASVELLTLDWRVRRPLNSASVFDGRSGLENEIHGCCSEIVVGLVGVVLVVVLVMVGKFFDRELWGGRLVGGDGGVSSLLLK
jgi:hypothetical protein